MSNNNSDRTRTRLNLLVLEHRLAPAVTASISTSFPTKLIVTGDEFANNILVTLRSGRVVVMDGTSNVPILNAPPSGLTHSGLSGIEITAGDGDDRIEIALGITRSATINGGVGVDSILGGKGADSITTGSDALGDFADGRDGNDTLFGSIGNDTLLGGKGNDVINASDGVNVVDGGEGNDSIIGGSGSENLKGGKGRDTIIGLDGNDLIYGSGLEIDTDKDGDNLQGGAGDDYIDGGLGNDTIDAGVGSDLVEAGNGHDWVKAGPDTVPGGVSDADVIYGGAGNDTLYGGWGNDSLYGESGFDSLVGGAGADTLNGGLNRDIFIGHGTNVNGTGSANALENFDTYKDSFNLTKPINGTAEPLDLQMTELNISHTLSALATISNSKSNYNFAGRIRHLGSGEYLVKLGDIAGNDWVPVNFDGTWTDNDAAPNAQERALPVTSGLEKQEFWSLLFHRAHMSRRGFNHQLAITQGDYDLMVTSPSTAMTDLTGKVDLPGSPFTFAGLTSPVGFGFADIVRHLASNRWLTVHTTANPELPGLQGNMSYAITKAFVSSGINYISLYNPTGFDKGIAGITEHVDAVGVKKNNGLITIKATDFFNSANFVSAWMHSFQAVPGNLPPTISDIGNATISAGEIYGPVAFTIRDDRTNPNALRLTVRSSNDELLPSSAVTLIGRDVSRRLIATPIVGQSGTTTVTIEAMDAEGNTTSDSFDLTVLPTPPIISTSDFGDSTKFLYTGDDAVQTGLNDGVLDPLRVAVVRGRVIGVDGSPLAGVEISVLNHAEFGSSLSRTDGTFDIVVNGGGPLTIVYNKNDFLPVHRTKSVEWRDYAVFPTVALTPLDSQVSTIDLSNGTDPIQVARGSVQTDSDGIRQSTLLFPQGTQATMTLPNGTTQPLLTVSVRATEYTVGTSGPMSMPGTLPATSGYTYAVELSVDEAMAAGATRVDFTQPVPVYVENFLNFPVGMAVPAGYYDREIGQWVASANGTVIKILSETATDVVLDTDGDGNADSEQSLDGLGITSAERAKLVELYNPGQTFWRTPVTHFTPWDFNWSFGPPLDAISPSTNSGGASSVNEPNSCQVKGSIIEVENQVLRETMPITGTSFTLNYSTAGAFGRTADDTRIIQLSGSSIPASLKRIDLVVTVAGREFTSSFAPATNLTTNFTWDGKDAYGRYVSTAMNGMIDIAYVYDGQYRSPSDLAATFGTTGVSAITGSLTRQEVSLHQKIETRFGSVTAWPTGLGGSTLSVNHFYDEIAQQVILGNGTILKASDAVQNTIRVVAGNGTESFEGDGGQATQATFAGVEDIAAAADGSLYIADSINNRIRRISTSGIITTIAGKDTPPPGSVIPLGNGEFATDVNIFRPSAVAVGPDGSIYLSEFFANRVRRITPDGRISIIVGDGPNGSQGGDSGDGGSSQDARLRYPRSLAVGQDGSLYIADTQNNKIRRVGSDGIITTYAGTGVVGFGGDGGNAASASFSSIDAITIAPDGSLYVADSSRIRRIRTDGIINTVVGTGSGGFSGDGGLASQAQFLKASSLSVSQDGSLFFVDRQSNRLRRVGNDGIINTIAGNGSNAGTSGVYPGDGGPSLQANLASPTGVTVSPNGQVFVANASRVFSISTPMQGAAYGDRIIPSKDGSEIYRFNSSGRHLQTIDALTQTPIYTFAYDSSGRLTSVTDATGNITQIERDADGKPTAIVSPYGQRTVLSLNINGYLNSVTNPSNESYTLGYGVGGLLTSFTDPRGNTSVMTYDSKGRLIRDSDPINGFTELTRTELGDGSYKVSTLNAENGTRQYSVEFLPDGSRRRTAIDGRGFSTVTLINPNGTEQITAPDGTISITTLGPDPRFGMMAPVVTQQTVSVPSGLTSTITGNRTATFSIPGDRTSHVTSLTSSTVVNGRTFSSVYDSSAKTIATTSAANRPATTLLDSLGRTSRVTLPGIEPTNYTYDSNGRIDTISQGTRTVRNAYDLFGRLSTITDPLNQVTRFDYDAANRVTRQTQPDGSFILFRYDIAGNLVGLTPPGQPEHTFTYNERNQVMKETPPTIGPADDSTRYVYNAARQLAQQALPGGQIISYAYCDCGRLTGVTAPWGQYDYVYSSSTGNLATVNSPGGFSMTWGYDGGLVTSETQTGTVAGRLDRIFNNDFQVTSERINNANSVSFAYDADGLLTQAGALTLNRNNNLGRIDSTYIGTSTAHVTENMTYNPFGEVQNYSADWNTQSLLEVDYTRDALGRITSKVDSINGTSKTTEYGYDQKGQLISVTENGQITQQYVYDPNGNRLSLTTTVGTTLGVYDDQDRLLSYGTKNFAYDIQGSLTTVTDTATGFITRYSYDAFKNLTRVELPTGQVIEYLIDGQNRRVGKKVDGVLVEGFIYNGQLRPVARLNGDGVITERFVYSTGINVPAYITKNGVNYRLVTDHLGSVRLVVNVETGAIAQQLDYDAYGRVIQDTNPGFQPFGYAGGLYEAATGLVRFGARDYDAESGRWTAKDPIGLQHDVNTFRYTSNDLINRVDPSGLADLFVQTGGSVHIGVGGGVNFGFVIDTDQPLQSGVFVATQYGVGLEISGGISYGGVIRDIEGAGEVTHATSPVLSCDIIYDDKGFNGASGGAGGEVSLGGAHDTSVTYTVSINDLHFSMLVAIEKFKNSILFNF